MKIQGHVGPNRLYNAPTDNTKPQQPVQSPDRLHKAPKKQYKAPTDYTKPPTNNTMPPKHYTKITNIRQNPKISNKDPTYLTTVAAIMILTYNIQCQCLLLVT